MDSLSTLTSPIEELFGHFQEQFPLVLGIFFYEL